MSMNRARNTNAYLNALNQEHKQAVSNAFDAAEIASRKILNASSKIKNVHPTFYDPAAEKIARAALYDASNASWKALLAAKQTFQKGNNVSATKEKKAAQKTHELQTFMSEITTNMDRFMNPLHSNNKSQLQRTVHRKIISARTQANDAREMWKAMLESHVAGGKTRRNKKSHRSRSRRH